MIQKARNKRPTTPYQLWLYQAAFFNFVSPWKSCCRNHDTPFDMLWQLWTGDPASFIAIGARDSYKTLTLASSETLDIVFNACGVVHIGAIESQALKCYAYVKKNLRNFKDMLVKEPLMSRTELTNGGHLEIIPCTINRVNSPHEPKVRFDEVELADVVAYNEAKFIAGTDEKGNKASICYTTTRKYAHGLAQQEIQNALAQNLRVIFWCYKDVTERCPDSRSGTDDTEIWVNPNTFEWAKKRGGNKELHSFVVKNKCLACPIVATCRGDLKRANGIKPIDDVILKFLNSTPDYWSAQMECTRPSRKGLVMYNFSTDINARAPIDWNIFMNSHGEFNKERFIQVWGKDWGWNPDATVVNIIDTQRDIVYTIKEFNFKMKTTPEIAAELLEWAENSPFGMPDDVLCDRSEPGLIATFQANGFPMARAVEETDIEGGCDLLNFLAKPFTRSPMWYVDPILAPTVVWEASIGYVRKNDPKTNTPGDKIQDKNNHFMDAMRYALWEYMRKYSQAAGQYVGMGGDMDSGIVTGDAGIIDEDALEQMSFLLLNSDG